MSQVHLYDGDVEGDEALEGVQVKTQYSKGYALSLIRQPFYWSGRDLVD